MSSLSPRRSMVRQPVEEETLESIVRRASPRRRLESGRLPLSPSMAQRQQVEERQPMPELVSRSPRAQSPQRQASPARAVTRPVSPRRGSAYVSPAAPFLLHVPTELPKQPLGRPPLYGSPLRQRKEQKLLPQVTTVADPGEVPFEIPYSLLHINDYIQRDDRRTIIKDIEEAYNMSEFFYNETDVLPKILPKTVFRRILFKTGLLAYAVFDISLNNNDSIFMAIDRLIGNETMKHYLNIYVFKVPGFTTITTNRLIEMLFPQYYAATFA